MPDTLEQVILKLSCDGATTPAIIGVLKEAGILDALVYRSCPECGGSRVLATGPPLNIGEPCPACADAPVAIVSAALREKAIDACFAADQAALSRLQKQGFPDIPRVSTAETCPVDIRPIVEAEVDAVLSTVLGQVRYAKEIGRWHDYYPGHIETGNAGRQTRDFVSLRSGDAIAILEEAGKEE